MMNFRNFGRGAAITLLALAGLTTNASAFTIDGNVEGFWYEAGLTANRGWGFQYLPTGPEQGILFVAGYVYDADGAATWVVGQAEVFDGEYEVDFPLLAFAGGAFGPGAGAPVSSDFGTLNVVFNSCHSADFTFTGGAAFNQTFDPFLQIVAGPGNDRCVYQREFSGCPAFATDLGDRNCGIGGTITLGGNTLAAFIDFAAEKARLNKELDKTAKDIASIEGRLRMWQAPRDEVARPRAKDLGSRSSVISMGTPLMSIRYSRAAPPRISLAKDPSARMSPNPSVPPSSQQPQQNSIPSAGLFAISKARS